MIPDGPDPTPRPAPQWVEELLSDTREIVRLLLEEPLLPLELLGREIASYQHAIHDAAAADRELGLALAKGATSLLSSAVSESTHRLVQVAVRYFVMDDDGDDDLASPFGFDDDVEVFNAVAIALGRPELLITMS